MITLQNPIQGRQFSTEDGCGAVAQKQLQGMEQLQFAVKDVSKDALPQGYDLIFCR